MRVCDLSVGMLSYCVGSEHVFAVLLDGDGRVRRFQLARCADALPRIETLMDALGQPLAWIPSRRAAVIRQFSEEWGATLLPPAAALESFDVLLIVPHQFLHGVPLHLAELGGETLATTHGVAYCSSATLLARCAERNAVRRVDPCAWTFPMNGDDAVPSGPPVRSCKSCAADILTAKDSIYQALARDFASHFAETTLGYTRADVKTALDPARRISGAMAASVAPDALCVVCHGHVDTVQNDRSGLLLWGTPGWISVQHVRVHDDTTLRVQDHPFADLPLRLESVPPPDTAPVAFTTEMLTTGELGVMCESDEQLVALFGCSTGTGAVASNDDFVSLAYQWLKIGATSVVANLWESDLEALTKWSHEFVDRWVRVRQPKAIAARDATRAFLASNPDVANQPELWGCMALLGDWL